MHYPKVSLAILLLPSALALPSTHGHLHQHEHKPYNSGVVSGAPFSSGTGGPFGMSNATASAAGTGTGSAADEYSTVYTTIQSTVYLTAPASAASAAAVESAPASAESAPLEAGSSAGGNCAAPVTVTYNPTVTVTVTANGGSPAGSDVQPAPIESASSAAVASASASPMYSETHTPDQSVAPVVSSPAAAPVTAQAPVSSKAASPVPLESSVAPVQSVIASPVGLSPQPVQASPSVAASSPAPAATGSTAAPPTGASTGKKRGLVIPAGGDDSVYQVKLMNASSSLSWVSSWYSIGPKDFDYSRFEFVPQMYGLNSVNDWDKNAEAMIEKGTKHFLAFGEPETYTTTGPQLHQDAATAATNWKSWMSKYSATGPVGSPCTLQSYDPDQKWQQDFLTACSGCDIGFVAMHWVDKAPPGKGAFQAQGFMEVVNNYTAIAGNKKVWIDNIQAIGANTDQMDFLKVILPFLDNNDKVERYAYWSSDKSTGTGFLNADGSPSDLGKWYAGIQ